MASSGPGWEVFTRISSQCWGSSRLHSWPYTFPAIHYDDAIWGMATYADDTTLYSKYDWASDLLEQLELASELNLQDTVD